MRKIAVVFMGIVMMLVASVTFAYPAHLNDDPNYILCQGRMGGGEYVDRSSLVVKQYKPPVYIIAVNVVSVPDADRGKTEISNVKIMTLKQLKIRWLKKFRKYYQNKGNLLF